ncbi:MAG: ABC transporter ATP-binding protein [Phycisphaerales bacterium]
MPASERALTMGKHHERVTPDAPAALSLRGLRFGYGRGWTMQLPTLEIGAGEQVLLTGGSGTGKSTLLHLIAGLIDPAEGRVEIAGQSVHALAGAKRDLFRGQHVGMIFQTFHLLEGFTARENVLAALMFSSIPPREHDQRAADLLARLGVQRIDAAAGELSVGQQQRVAVARAVACGPALVLADEPTASLDPENAARAMDVIQSACRDQNAALLCTSHDPSMVARFPRSLALESIATFAGESNPQEAR